nr:hypothetical protein B0A51_08179 [Rachicladosporium sp. CCFEE 5018]
MFPELYGGYMESEVRGMVATAPRGRIIEWCKDLLEEQDNPYRAVPQKKEDYQYGLDDALIPEPGESASLCHDGGDRLDDRSAAPPTVGPPGRHAAPGEVAGAARAAMTIPIQLVRGREVIFEHLREYWPVRRRYEQVFDRIEELQQNDVPGQDADAALEAELYILQQQEDEALEHMNRLGAALADAQSRQAWREQEYTAATGIAFPPLGHEEPADTEDFTAELFAGIEDLIASAPATVRLSPRAASNARFDAEMRDAIAPLQNAHTALWRHRETYMDQRLRHEAGNDPGIPDWDPTWPREIFDREHLREGIRLTREAKRLHELWRARLEEAQERGVGPFITFQGELFPHVAEGFAISEENGTMEAAPWNGILEWMENTPPENQQSQANGHVPLRRRDCMIGLRFAHPPEPGESASCCDVALHVVEGIERRREGTGYPIWRRNRDTRDLGNH